MHVNERRLQQGSELNSQTFLSLFFLTHQFSFQRNNFAFDFVLVSISWLLDALNQCDVWLPSVIVVHIVIWAS